MNLFRGYIVTVGKKPIEKFKDTDLCSFEEVRECREYAGVLDAGTVLIDVDDAKQAQRLFDMVKAMGVCCQVRQTTRGKHFYFKNNGLWDKCATGVTLAIGIKADIKVGLKNSISILKKDGVERAVIYDTADLLGEYDCPPFWLRPIKTKLNVFDLGDGDGRNNVLFEYILPLQTAKFTKDEIRETERLINKWIFAKPLSDGELDTVLRDEAFETNLMPEFFAGKVFLFDEFAQYLIRELHVRRINGALHVYKDGVYVDGYRRIEGEMLKIIPTLSDQKRKEVLKYLEVVVSEETPQAEAHFVAFKNGVLNVVTGELVGFSPDIVITNRVPWEYRKGAVCDLVDKTLLKLACGDAEVKSLLEEAAGYCFYRRNELRKAFIFLGDKSNGKSTYIAMILKMLGEENVSALDLKELGERFKSAELFRKLANLGDDIGDEFISDTAMFKKLVSGERVTAERKGQDPFSFVNYAKFIFSANNLPRVRDRTGAVIDRLIIVPFRASFSRDDPDYRPFIKYELCSREAIERLIVLGVEGLRRVLENKAFTTSAAVKKEIEEYDLNNNPIKMFFREVDLDSVEREPTNEWYSRYGEWCLTNGFQSLSKIEFSKKFIKDFNLEVVVRKIAGKSVKFYRRKE